MIFTVADARSFIAKYVDDGRCPDDARVLERINECNQFMLPKAPYKGTLVRYKCCVTNNCICMPYFVEKILKVNVCGTPTTAWSRFYEFLEHGPGTQDMCEGAEIQSLIDMGNGPLMASIPHGGKKIIAFSTEEADTSLEMDIYGRTLLHNEVRTGTNPGESIPIHYWKDGVEGSIDGVDAAGNSLLTFSTNTFIDISLVVKPTTKGHVSLWAWDEDALAETVPTEGIWFLGKYFPDQLQPDYRHYKIQGHSFTAGESVTALCKIGYYPLVHDSDVLHIQSLLAYRYASMALNFYNKKDQKAGMAYEGLAMRLAKEQLCDYEQITNEFDIEMEDSMYGLGQMM